MRRLLLVLWVAVLSGCGGSALERGPVTLVFKYARPIGPARPSVAEFAARAELQDIYFDFDRYDIRLGDARLLDASAAWLRANPASLVLIEGHCDERGTDAYNMALGDRRAKATMDYLVSRGIQAERITTLSYGEERPVCREHTEACWAKNRRAHFLVKAR
ncbi:MAG: peptidoglycan-associated lipoprotein [Candidatus Rokubacteria bacterium 13_1_40CM_69_96]|nr:MAG: peptidoglycan-associated lipoprotein [Candidatus Rokubacteria bacterium 13_1_40CM_69_96]